MNFNRILQIIKEEAQKWFDDNHNYFNDEPSIADRYYDRAGIQTPRSSQNNPNEISGELIGYVIKAWTTELKEPIGIYKNPKNLRGYDKNARAILTDAGDIYVGTDEKAFHYNMLELLAKKNIIPSSSVVLNYGQQMPEEYITVLREGLTNTFVQSTAYDEFPIYYEEMFEYARQRQVFNFKIVAFDAPN